MGVLLLPMKRCLLPLKEKEREVNIIIIYDATLRLKIACENGKKSTVEKFSMELCYEISEGTVRNFKCTYLSKLKTLGDADAITSLPHATLARHLLVGEIFEMKILKK